MKITFRTLAHPRADLERLKRGPQKSQNCLPKSLRGGQSQKKNFFCNLKICSNVRKKVSISKYVGYRIPQNASPSLAQFVHLFRSSGVEKTALFRFAIMSILDMVLSKG